MTEMPAFMQPKKLLKNNHVIVADDRAEVTKVIRTPFSLFAEALCRHESGCLQSLAELGFDGAPRLIGFAGTSFTMEKVSGKSLNRYDCIDEQACLRILDMVQRLHDLGFAHGNLRRSNIFINDDNQPMLIDFETCSRRSSPLFALFKFSDQVRLHLLWHSSFVVPAGKRVGAVFPTYVTWLMVFITPINRFAAAFQSRKKSIRKRIRGSRRLPTEQG